MVFFSKTIGKAFSSKRIGLAALVLVTVVLADSFAEVPKYYGNGGAGTVVEINEKSISDDEDTALVEKGLDCIVKTIEDFSKITILDKRNASLEKEELSSSDSGNYFVLSVSKSVDADGLCLYRVECRIKSERRKTDLAGFVRNDVSEKDVESMRIFREAAHYLLQSMHVILTPAARKQILSGD